MILKCVFIKRLGKIKRPSGFACVKKVVIGHDNVFSTRRDLHCGC